MGSTTEGRHLHLGIFLFAVGYHPGAWRLPESDPAAALDPDFIVSIAQKVEAAKFDFFFLGDALATSAQQQYVFPSQTVRLEPFTMIGHVAAKTERIGLIVTANTTYAEPYHLARQTASLDYLSKGRLAWNVVTGADQRAAHNFSRDQHWDNTRRYDWAEELVSVVEDLWDSWEDGALAGDKEAGVLVDPARLHPVDHHGEFFDVAGPLNVARPPQGRIPLVNAGTSERARDFGARRSTAVFAGTPTYEAALAFSADVKGQAAQAGRDPGDVAILPGLVPYVGRTSEDASALYRRLSALIAARPDTAALERELGIPLRGLDVSEAFPAFDEADPALAHAAFFLDQTRMLNRTDRPTIRQVFEYSVARGRGHFLAIGSAEEIADTIQHWFETGAADGFNICPPHLPGGLDDFIELVLPILRERGLFRTEYTGSTFREHFGAARPASRFAGGEVAPHATGVLTEEFHRVDS